MAAIAEPEPRVRRAPPPTQEERDRREYRQTLAWVFGVHLFALLLFLIAGAFRPVKKPEQIAWLLGGEFGGGDAAAVSAEASPEIEAAPELEPIAPEPEPEPEIEREPPPPLPPPPAPSELVIPQATPVPATPKPATPKPSTPKPATPKPATPAPTPKPSTPKPSTPKPATPQPATPKVAAAKATPKASPKSAGEKSDAAIASAKSGGASSSATPGVNSAPGGAKSGPGKGTGNTGKGPGGGAASDFGAYFARLRDTYYPAWDQPTSLDRSSGDLVTTLRIKAQRDGTVLGYEIMKGSGNSVMDGSVLAAAQQIKKIEPIPQGLGREDILEIPINFKLDQGQ